MFYREPTHIMNKYYKVQTKMDMWENNMMANKVQVYANGVIDDLVTNDGKGYTNQQIQSDLYNLNKPKIDKEYEKIITDKKTSNSVFHEIEVKTMADGQTKYITQAQYEKLYDNINICKDILGKWGVQVDKYKDLTEKYPKTDSRKDLIQKSIADNNIITSWGILDHKGVSPNSTKVITMGKNIKPHFQGYRELGHITEILHRRAQNQSRLELAKAQNENAKANGEPLPNTHKTWIWTGRGKTTRHMSNHGQTVGFDEKFTIVNDADGQVDLMDYPLDPEVSSSNTGRCYCRVEYHDESGTDVKFNLTPAQMKHLDNKINKINEVYNDAIKISTKNLNKQEILNKIIQYGTDIPLEHYDLASELIYEYAFGSGLDEIPLYPAYKVLIEHFRDIKLNECKKLLKKFYTKTQTLENTIALAEAQADLLGLVEPTTDLESFSEKEVIDDIAEDTNSENFIKFKEAMQDSFGAFVNSKGIDFLETTRKVTENYFLYSEIYAPITRKDYEDIIFYGERIQKQINLKTAENEYPATFKKKIKECKDDLQETIDDFKKGLEKFDNKTETTPTPSKSEGVKKIEEKLQVKVDNVNNAKLNNEYEGSLTDLIDNFEKELLSFKSENPNDYYYLIEYCKNTQKLVYEKYDDIFGEALPHIKKTYHDDVLEPTIERIDNIINTLEKIYETKSNTGSDNIQSELNVAPKKSHNVELFEGYLEEDLNNLKNAETNQALGEYITKIANSYESEFNMFGHDTIEDYYHIIKYGEQIKEIINQKWEDFEVSNITKTINKNNLDKIENTINNAKQEYKKYTGKDYDNPKTETIIENEIIETPKEKSQTVKDIEAELTDDFDFLKDHGTKGIGALNSGAKVGTHLIKEIDKNYTKLTSEDVIYLDEYANEIIKQIDDTWDTLVSNNAPNLDPVKIIEIKVALTTKIDLLKQQFKVTTFKEVDIPKSEIILTMESNAEPNLNKLKSSNPEDSHFVVLYSKKLVQEYMIDFTFTSNLTNASDYYYAVKYGKYLKELIKGKTNQEGFKHDVYDNMVKKEMDKIDGIIEKLVEDYNINKEVCSTNEEMGKVIEENLEKLLKEENLEIVQTQQEINELNEQTNENKLIDKVEKWQKKKQKELVKKSEKVKKAYKKSKDLVEKIYDFEEMAGFDEFTQEDLVNFNKFIEIEIEPFIKANYEDATPDIAQNINRLKRISKEIYDRNIEDFGDNNVDLYVTKKLLDNLEGYVPFVVELTPSEKMFYRKAKGQSLNAHESMVMGQKLFEDITNNKVLDGLHELSAYETRQDHQQEYQKLYYTLKNIELYFEVLPTPLNNSDFYDVYRLLKEVKKYKKVYAKDDYFHEDFLNSEDMYKEALDKVIDKLLNYEIELNYPTSTKNTYINNIENAVEDLKYINEHPYDDDDFQDEETISNMKQINDSLEIVLFLKENTDIINNDDLINIKKAQDYINDSADLAFVDDVLYDKILEHQIVLEGVDIPQFETKESLKNLITNRITTNYDEVLGNSERGDYAQEQIRHNFEEIDNYLTEIGEKIYDDRELHKPLVERMTREIGVYVNEMVRTNSSNIKEKQLTPQENELLIKKANIARNSLHYQIDYLYSKSQITSYEARQMHTDVDKRILQEHIIRSSIEVQTNRRTGAGHDIETSYSTNVVQGKATVSYFTRFKPIAPSKEILDKFNNRQAMTSEEIKSLTPNNMHYLIRQLERATVCSDTYDDSGSYSYRLAQYGNEDCSDFFGNDPYRDTEIEKYGLTSRFWTGGKYKDINKFLRQHLENFNNRTIGAIVDTSGINYWESSTGVNGKYKKTKRAVVNQLLKMTKNKSKKGYISFRGQSSFTHGPTEIGATFNYSRGDGEYGAGFKSTAITEAGTGGFSGIDTSEGTVSSAMITMLNPAGSTGYYFDGKSKYSWECEVLVPPDAQYQILAYDPETNTMLVYRIEDEGSFL